MNRQIDQLARLMEEKLGMASNTGKSLLAIADRAVLAGTNFLVLIVLGRVSGLEELGVFAMAWAVLQMVLVIQEGLVLTPFTVFRPKKPALHIQAAQCSSAAVFCALIGLAAVLAALIVAAAVALRSGDLDLIAVIVVVTLLLPVMIMREFVRRVLFADMNVSWVFLLDVQWALLLLFVLGWFSVSGVLSAVTVFLGILLAALVPYPAWLLANRHRFGSMTLAKLRLEAKRYWKFSRWIFATQISDIAQGHGIVWLVAAFGGPGAAGIFAACNSLSMVTNPLIIGFGNYLLPRTADARHRNGIDEVLQVVRKATMFLVVGAGGICAVLAAFGEPLVEILYQPGNMEHVAAVVAFLALARFLSASGFAVDNGLMVIGRPDINLTASLTGLICTMGLSAMLLPAWDLTGAALAVTIGTLAAMIIQFSGFRRTVGGLFIPARQSA